MYQSTKQQQRWAMNNQKQNSQYSNSPLDAVTRIVKKRQVIIAAGMAFGIIFWPN